jgi:hypothetical protein
MPKKLSKEEATKLRESSKRTTKSLIFGDEINELKKGEELFISDKEWTMKTTMTAYYYAKFAKGIDKNDREFSYGRVKDGFVITKLK